jgi:hypothetical protein
MDAPSVREKSGDSDHSQRARDHAVAIATWFGAHDSIAKDSA